MVHVLIKGAKMKKIALLLCVLIPLLSACQSKDPDAITLEKLLAAFEEQGLSLKKSAINDSIFGMNLNGVKPVMYELEEKLLTIYIYPSSTERQRGWEDFQNKTATMNVVSFEVYEVKNVLIFYVYEQEEIESVIDTNISTVINKLKQE